MITRASSGLAAALIAIVGFFSATATAHNFGPASMQNTIGPDGKARIDMRLTSKWSGFYSFSVGGKTLVDAKGEPVRKYVMAGMAADFPMTIDRKYVRDSRILICSWENRDVMFRQEVCFNVKVE